MPRYATGKTNFFVTLRTLNSLSVFVLSFYNLATIRVRAELLEIIIQHLVILLELLVLYIQLFREN